MADAVGAFQEGFVDRLMTLLRRHPEVEQGLDIEEARRLGAEGADAALAPLVWAAAVGERWDTPTVTQFLGVTRQALHKRVVNGSILGLPGRGTTWFPVWQFDVSGRQVRPEVADLTAVFREALGALDPFVVASWAVSDQPELGMAPEEWLAAGKDPADVVRVARRAAEELSK
jgi:hypothetical protein